MNATIAGLGVVILGAILTLGFAAIYRKKPMRDLRDFPAFNRLRRAMGLAVEDGSRLHISLGNASMTNPGNASALVGFSVLKRVAQLSSMSDRPPVVTSGDGALSILSQDSLAEAYHQANAMDQYDPNRGFLAGVTPFSYAAAALSVIHDPNVSGNILIGNYGPEAALLADAADQEHAYMLAASDGLQAQAVLYASAQDPLIGEELFASGAYLHAGRMHTASLHAQDILRLVMILALVVGAVLKLAGVL